MDFASYWKHFQKDMTKKCGWYLQSFVFASDVDEVATISCHELSSIAHAVYILMRAYAHHRLTKELYQKPKGHTLYITESDPQTR